MNKVLEKIRKIYKKEKEKQQEKCFRQAYNTLELNYKILKESIESEFYENYMKFYQESEEMKFLKEENKNLRKKIKELKGKIKEYEQK